VASGLVVLRFNFTIPGADHFFLGDEDRMAAAVVEAWRMRTTAAQA
jgi:alpha/beta superfamily hydrolase